MNILQVYSRPIKIGGHFRSGLAMAKGLTVKGHKVIAIAPGTTPDMHTAFEKAGVPLRLVPSVGRSTTIPCTTGWKHIVMFAKDEKVDIIHAMDFGSMARSYLAAIKAKTAFLCTQSGGDSQCSPPPTKETVIIFSEEQASIYSDIYKHPKSQTEVIRARIDHYYYYPIDPSSDFIRHHNLDRAGLKIGIAARLEYSKSHKIDALIAFATHHASVINHINIYVVGDGNLRQQMQTKANGIANSTVHMHFLGPIHSITEMNQFYNSCDVVAGSGRGIMEAMACHKPVIILGERGEAQLLGPESINECAVYNFSGRHFRGISSVPSLPELLASIEKDPSKLEPSAHHCYEYFNSHLSASVGVDQLLKIYQRMRPSSTILDFIKWYSIATAYIAKGVFSHKLSRIHQFRNGAT